MIFYDGHVTKYILRISRYGRSDPSAEDVYAETGGVGPRLSHQLTYRRIGDAVLEYLNEKKILGVAYQESGHTHEQLKRFHAHLPTEEETEQLRQFLDDVVIPAWCGQPLSLPITALNIEDLPNRKTRLYVDSDGFLGVESVAEDLYHLYIAECYEIWASNTRVAKCPYCGRYFRPRTSKADFCSNKCRNAYHNENSSSIYKQYRRAYDRNGKYINNPCHVSTPDEWGAFEQWKWEAKEARKQREAGLITKAEFDAVIERNIFGRKRKRRSAGADTDSTGGADDAIHKEENE